MAPACVSPGLGLLCSLASPGRRCRPLRAGRRGGGRPHGRSSASSRSTGAPDAVAAEITDALRQRVAATKGYQLLQGKDLVEVKLVFACPDEAPACMSQAGKSLGAAKLIFGNVKQAGNDYQVTLKLLDVSRAVVESFTAETVPKKHADAERASARWRPAGSPS